jgi:hypothetical protein
MNRPQREGTAPNPIGQRRSIERDSLPSIDLSLPIKRKVIGMFGDQDLCRRTFGRAIRPRLACGVRPCRRSTSETTTPAARVSSTTRALKSSVNQRRRPAPVITSSRRTVFTSGSSLWSSVDTSRSPIQRSAHSTIIRRHKRCGQNSAYGAHPAWQVRLSFSAYLPRKQKVLQTSGYPEGSM